MDFFGDPDSDVLPYPHLINRTKISMQAQKFLLLTSKEAQYAKLESYSITGWILAYFSPAVQ